MPVEITSRENDVVSIQEPENSLVESKKNIGLIYEAEIRIKGVKSKIQEVGAEYLKNLDSMSKEEERKQHKRIDVLYEEIKEYQEEKVRLAKRSESILQKKMNRLEPQLPKLKTKILSVGNKESSKFSSTVVKKRSALKRDDVVETALETNPKKVPKVQPKLTKCSSDEDDEGALVIDHPIKPKPKKEAQKKRPISASSNGNKSKKIVLKKRKIPASRESDSSGEEEFDIPVDPDEPTYCLCHQVSYGEMIGCDNSNCPIEWFHFPCVGITAEPKGKWYCPKCTQNKKGGTSKLRKE